MKSKDIQLLEEAYGEVKRDPSSYVPNSLKNKILNTIGSFFGNASSLENTLDQIKQLLTSTNIRSKTDIPFRDFLAREKRLKESVLEEGLISSYREFTSKFSNFSVVEIIRLFKKIGDIIEASNKGEIGGMESIEAIAGAYKHFKETTGFRGFTSSAVQPTQ